MITKEYRVGEVFQYEGKVLQVCNGEAGAEGCEVCVFGAGLKCSGRMLCSAGERCDRAYVYYKVVTEPAEGMLYRSAYDGKLYRFIKELDGIIPKNAYCLQSTMCCQDLTYEIFEEALYPPFDWYRREFHWVLVPETEEGAKDLSSAKEPRRHITLSSALHKGGEVIFHIIEQTHRGSVFTPTGSLFTSMGGVQLQSSAEPYKMCLPRGGVGMWVRGGNISSDEGGIRVSESEYAQILEAVKEYNETGGVGYSKPAEMKQEEAKVTEEKRYIELKILKTTDTEVTFRIEKQTHRETNKEFKASNGIRLISRCRPAYDGVYTSLYLRGIDASEDLRELVVTHATYILIAEAVQEYNETNGEGYKRDPYEWLKDGVRYWTVSLFSNKVYRNCMLGDRTDSRFKEANMIFRTEAQAKEALARLQKTLSDYRAELEQEG